MEILLLVNVLEFVIIHYLLMISLSNVSQIVHHLLIDIWKMQLEDVFQLVQLYLTLLVTPTKDIANTIVLMTGSDMRMEFKEYVLVCVLQLQLI